MTWLLMVALWLGDPEELLRRAGRGDQGAQAEAAMLQKRGRLPELDARRAKLWFRRAEDCLVAGKKAVKPEHWLRCAAEGGVAEGQYLLGVWILNGVGAEDEPERFEGLAWVVVAAKRGYGPAERKWESLARELAGEDLERVEQTANRLVGGE